MKTITLDLVIVVFALGLTSLASGVVGYTIGKPHAVEAPVASQTGESLSGCVENGSHTYTLSDIRSTSTWDYGSTMDYQHVVEHVDLRCTFETAKRIPVKTPVKK